MEPFSRGKAVVAYDLISRQHLEPDLTMHNVFPVCFYISNI
jgi:hypothetical protein